MLMREPGAPVQKAKTRTHACRNFRPAAQQSPVQDQKLSSPPEVSCAARPRALHDQADTRSSPAKRSTMPGDAEASSIERRVQTRDAILTREMGAQLACGNNAVQLHVRARGPSPGAGDHACTSTGIQAAGQSRVCDLAMGEVLDAVRF